MAKMTHPEILNKAKNPRFQIVEFKKVKSDISTPDGTPISKIVFINPPANFSLIGDPIEPENIALLENLDYIEPVAVVAPDAI